MTKKPCQTAQHPVGESVPPGRRGRRARSIGSGAPPPRRSLCGVSYVLVRHGMNGCQDGQMGGHRGWLRSESATFESHLQPCSV